MKNENNVTANVGFDKDSLTVTLQTMFNGMEGLLQSKTVIGDPIDMGEVKLLPLLEITAGMAGGSFAAEAKQRGAAAMTAKITPVAMLLVQGKVVRLINIKNQDAITKLVDMIPDAVDKITGSRIYAASVAKAEEIAEKIGIRIIKDNEQSEAESSASNESEENSK